MATSWILYLILPATITTFSVPAPQKQFVAVDGAQVMSFVKQFPTHSECVKAANADYARARHMGLAENYACIQGTVIKPVAR